MISAFPKLSTQHISPYVYTYLIFKSKQKSIDSCEICVQQRMNSPEPKLTKEVKKQKLDVRWIFWMFQFTSNIEMTGLSFDIFERRCSIVLRTLHSACSQSASWELQDAWQQTGWGGLPRDSQCGQWWHPRGHTGDRGAAAAGHPLHAHLVPPESGDPCAPCALLTLTPLSPGAGPLPGLAGAVYGRVWPGLSGCSPGLAPPLDCSVCLVTSR